MDPTIRGGFLDRCTGARYAVGMRAAPLLLAALLASGLVGACSPARGFCEANADCRREILGVEIPDSAGSADDSIAVCTANQEGQVRALRANEELECRAAADAIEAFQACIGAAFADNTDGCEVLDEDCDDERDDMNDALEDIDGDECSAGEE